MSAAKALPFEMVRARLRSLRAHAACHFWDDSVSLLDAGCLVDAATLAPAAVTDTYLLALAVKHGGQLVRFDRRIAWHNVSGAKVTSILVLRGLS